jgi:hypothetical protein
MQTHKRGVFRAFIGWVQKQGGTGFGKGNYVYIEIDNSRSTTIANLHA